MSDKERVLSRSAAQVFYDRFGKKQDNQGFYENPALDDLIAHAGFEEAQRVFEFGCGTGKFAARLLESHLPAAASYLGCDLSLTMVALARSRLAAFPRRAEVCLAGGVVYFPVPDKFADRVVSTYVLDLLSEEDIRRFFAEAHRVLVPGGRVCLASLTRGSGFLSRVFSALWMAIFRLNPSLVGGCRPIRLSSLIDSQQWQIVHQRDLAPFGVASEVLILEAKSASE